MGKQEDYDELKPYQHKHRWVFALFQTGKSYVDQFGMPADSTPSRVFYVCTLCDCFKSSKTIDVGYYDWLLDEFEASPTEGGDKT